jgi:hypothetical protein
LYVKVNGSKVPYDGDAADMRRAWQAWNIDLASFSVNLQSVTSVAIGVEGSGAAGTLLLDDIRLYALSREFITPVQPDLTGLVGHWALDGNVQDSSGLGNHGTAIGAPTYAIGKVGQAMSFDGTNDYVAIDGVADDITSNDITPVVTTWAGWLWTMDTLTSVLSPAPCMSPTIIGTTWPTQGSPTAGVCTWMEFWKERTHLVSISVRATSGQ